MSPSSQKDITDQAQVPTPATFSPLMNSIALNYFFSINGISDPEIGQFSAFQNQPIETLPVLRSALFVKRLSYSWFDLNPRIERMCNEVSDIRVLAARLEAVSILFPQGDRIVPLS